jgi:hypothetical protein
MVDGLIKINNKEYFLKFTINSLCEMKECGLDVMKLDETMDFTQIRSLFYFGLKKIHGQENKSVEQAGDLMSDYLEAQGTMEDLGNIISKALIKSLGMKQNEGK